MERVSRYSVMKYGENVLSISTILKMSQCCGIFHSFAQLSVLILLVDLKTDVIMGNGKLEQRSFFWESLFCADENFN